MFALCHYTIAGSNNIKTKKKALLLSKRNHILKKYTVARQQGVVNNLNLKSLSFSCDKYCAKKKLHPSSDTLK